MPTDVWVYWEGKRWPHIDVCLRTIERACRAGKDRFHLITGENYADYMPTAMIHPRWREIRQLGVRSDCVRACLLAAHGGVYVDADTLAIRSPGELLGTGRADLRCTQWTHKRGRPLVAGYVAAGDMSLVARQWLENINGLLESDFERVQRDGWCLLGEECLTHAMSACLHEGALVELFPLEQVLPIEIDTEVESFFECGDPLRRIDGRTLLFGLNHSWFVSRRPDDFRYPERWERSPLLIHRLLTLAEEYWT
jgi:hypothetical protein